MLALLPVIVSPKPYAVKGRWGILAGETRNRSLAIGMAWMSWRQVAHENRNGQRKAAQAEQRRW